MYKYLLASRNNGIATITLNRPEVYNSLNETMCMELLEELENCKAAEDVKVIVLTGAGNGFCAGQDIKAVISGNFIPSEVMERTYNPIVRLMRGMDKVILCQLNGIAVGAGFSLALSCDIIVASDAAAVSAAFVGIGLVPDTGLTYYLPRIVGRLKAFELLSTGRKITIQEALTLGLVNKVVPAADLEKSVAELAAFYLTSPTVATALIKGMLEQSYDLDLEKTLALEAKMQDIAAKTEDFTEAIHSFAEKRKPVFKGR